MKKLLVLLMVLGLVSSAQASLSLSLSATQIGIDETTTLSVVSTDAANWSGYIILSEDVVNWADPVAADYEGAMTMTTAAGNLASNGQDVTFVAAWFVAAGGTAPAPSAGTQFSIDIKGLAAGTIYISLQDASDPYPEISTNGPLTLVVPEPMTIGLLGLGGLLLRRRR